MELRTGWCVDGLRLILLVLLFQPLALHGEAAALMPAPYPNHYIIVVDASYSTVRSKVRARAYRELLQQELPAVLTSRGFDNIPAAALDRDVVSVFMFGIVPGKHDASVAHQVLDQYSFRKDFIHPVATRSRMTSEELRSSLWPREFFRLTVLRWAKQSAMATLPSASKADVANRTFLILVSDGEPNEEDTASRWGDETDVRETEKLLENTDALYSKSDGAGRDNSAFRQRIDRTLDGEKATFFIEAQELVPRSRSRFYRSIEQIAPFESFEFDYVEGGDGGTSSLHLTAVPSLEFRQWLATHEASTESAFWNGAWGASLAPGIDAALVVPLPQEGPPCSAMPVDVWADGQVRHRDPLFGLALFDYRLPQTVTVPPSDACAASTRRRLLVITGSLLLALALLGYFIVERRRRSRPQVAVPGIVRRFPLRAGVPDAYPYARPVAGSEAFSVVLPPLWKQRLFCAGMKIGISGEAAASIQWPVENGRLSLPHRIGRRVLAVWKETPPQQANLVVTLSDMGGSIALNIIFSTPHHPVMRRPDAGK